MGGTARGGADFGVPPQPLAPGGADAPHGGAISRFKKKKATNTQKTPNAPVFGSPPPQPSSCRSGARDRVGAARAQLRFFFLRQTRKKFGDFFSKNSPKIRGFFPHARCLPPIPLHIALLCLQTPHSPHCCPPEPQILFFFFFFCFFFFFLFFSTSSPCGGALAEAQLWPWPRCRWFLAGALEPPKPRGPQGRLNIAQSPPAAGKPQRQGWPHLGGGKPRPNLVPK